MKGLKIMDINSKLTEMGIILPEAPAPAANYIPYLEATGLVFISGQVSQDENGLITGTKKSPNTALINVKGVIVWAVVEAVVGK